MKEDHTANYFSHSNQTATEMRESIAEESLEMLIDWLKTKGGNVAIHGMLVVSRKTSRPLPNIYNETPPIAQGQEGI